MAEKLVEAIKTHKDDNQSFYAACPPGDTTRSQKTTELMRLKVLEFYYRLVRGLAHNKSHSKLNQITLRFLNKKRVV